MDINTNEENHVDDYKLSFWEEMPYNFVGMFDFLIPNHFRWSSRIDRVARRWKIDKRDAVELCLAFDLAQG
jgi:hypothetical protein